MFACSAIKFTTLSSVQKTRLDPRPATNSPWWTPFLHKIPFFITVTGSYRVFGSDTAVEKHYLYVIKLTMKGSGEIVRDEVRSSSVDLFDCFFQKLCAAETFPGPLKNSRAIPDITLPGVAFSEDFCRW